MNVAAIAKRLTSGQRPALLGLDEDFCVLGCAEPYAVRLAVGKPTRPALVEEGPRSPEGWRTFRLTPRGWDVRGLLFKDREALAQ